VDMAGSLWEWVEDCWYGSYSGAPADGTAWTSSCSSSERVERGGAFDNSAASLRSAKRHGRDPGNRYANVGARCLRPFP
jgi:formylglycine-generating enzyme required for sulfatase activity